MSDDNLFSQQNSFTPVKTNSADGPSEESTPARNSTKFTLLSEDTNSPELKLKRQDCTKYDPKLLTVEEYKKKYFARHFFILVAANMAAQTNYALLSFLINLFTQVYQTALCAGISMAIGYLCAGVLMERVGLRFSFFLCSVLSSCGGLSLLFFGLPNQDSVVFPVLYLITFMGTSGLLPLCRAAVIKLIEVKRASRVMGVANFFAFGFSSGAPLVTTLGQTTALTSFCVLIICSGVLTTFFVEPPNEARQIRKKAFSVPKKRKPFSW